MSIAELAKLALDLPPGDRAALAVNLLHSLPPFLADEDEGITEALRRDAAISAGDSRPLCWEELDAKIRDLRG